MDAPIFRLDRHSLPGPHIFAAGPRVSLEIVRGRVQQRVRAIHGRVFLIGTAHDCDLVLGDLSFPEAYAYLFVDGERVSIRRLGAGPELIVCGDATDVADLFHGDTIAFGPFELKLLIDMPPRGRRGPGDDDTTGREANRSAEFGDHAASDEMWAMLAQLGRDLAETSAAIRIYEAPEERQSIDQRRRATA
jgi:hypothetical protein